MPGTTYSLRLKSDSLISQFGLRLTNQIIGSFLVMKVVQQGSSLGPIEKTEDLKRLKSLSIITRMRIDDSLSLQLFLSFYINKKSI
jgi:hypothetical protein